MRARMTRDEGALAEVVDLALVLRHASGDALADQRVDDALGLDDQVSPRGAALELLVGPECAHLILAPAQKREALQITAVGPQQHYLEVLDPAAALEAAPVLHALVEYLDGALLAPAHHLTPPDEQRCVGHR